MLLTSFNDILKEDQTLAIRLAFIDFKVFYTGMLSRIDIMNEFDVSEITASRVISQYREFRRGNISYDNKSKRFELKKDTYEPLVKFNAKDALRMLSEGFDKNYLIRGRGFIPYEPIGFIQPPLENSFVSIITRAIAAGKKLSANITLLLAMILLIEFFLRLLFFLMAGIGYLEPTMRIRPVT